MVFILTRQPIDTKAFTFAAVSQAATNLQLDSTD